MKHLFLLLMALPVLPWSSAWAQTYGAYANPTNGAPVARVSFLRSQWAATNVLRDSSLLLYMPLADIADQAYDYSGNGLTSPFSGNGNNGSFAAGSYMSHWEPCPTYCGKLGSSAAYFKAAAPNSITTPSFTIPVAFTVSVWVRANTEINSYARILETNFATGFYLGTDTTHTKFEFLVDSSALSTCAQSSAIIASGIASNAWTMVTGTYDGTTYGNLYINGALVAGPCSFTPPSLLTSTMRIGCQMPTCTTGGSFDGQFADIRVYGRALTTGEILAIYTAENH